MLSLFSGPSRPNDGLRQFATQIGLECTCMDTELDPSKDVCHPG